MNLIRRAAPLGWFFMAVICAVVLLVGAGAWFFISIPDGADLKGCLTTQMYEVHLCPTDATYAPLKQIAPAMRNAVIVSEDAAFWDHKGIDWVELRKSFEKNMEKGRIARGGSTITQQLAKNVYLSAEKSLLRKIREAVIAIRLEKRYDKNFLLEKYLNVVEFDKDIYGVKKAADHYFGVSPANLSIAQSAWLAFLLPNPKKYSVSYHKNKLTPFAFKQMSEIIDRLYRFKRITEEQKIAAIREARAFFGGLSGESRELEEEFDRGDGESEEESDSGASFERRSIIEEPSPTSKVAAPRRVAKPEDAPSFDESAAPSADSDSSVERSSDPESE